VADFRVGAADLRTWAAAKIVPSLESSMNTLDNATTCYSLPPLAGGGLGRGAPAASLIAAAMTSTTASVISLENAANGYSLPPLAGGGCGRGAPAASLIAAAMTSTTASVCVSTSLFQKRKTR